MDNIYEIVNKLIGPVNPIGDTNIDSDRLKNLKSMILLVDKLISDIDEVASKKGRIEYSIRQAAEVANKCLDDLRIK